MPRPELPVDPEAGPLERFAHDLRQLRRAAGAPSYKELAGRTRFSASALSDAARGRQQPSLDLTLAYVDACGGDRVEWADRWQELAAALSADAGANGDGSRRRSPYLGLATYRSEDADLFFGRERLVDELVARIARGRFLAVLGASGSGKSSVLQAGLVTAAREGRLGSGEACPVVLVTPGAHPISELVRHGLIGEGGGTLVAPEGGELLLVVDQFEELFTACSDVAQTARFIDLLLSAQALESQVRVVLGVRADFYGHCARYADLAAALQDANVLVGALTAEELRNVVVKPAARMGVNVDPALVATIIADVGGEPGALPLLSHALQEMWWTRRGERSLTITGYRAVGGLHGAIARTAERVYGGAAPDKQRIVRRVLLRMIVPRDDGDDAAIPVGRAELGGDSERTETALERLAANRLVTLDGDTVRIAHEALIRSWPRLREWLAEDREGRRLHRRLAEAATVWEEVGRDPGALYRGTPLAVAVEWAGRNDNAAALTSQEQAFLQAGRDAEATERAAVERRSRRQQVLIVVMAVLLLIAGAAGGTAWNQASDAVSRQMAAEATAMAGFDPSAAARRALAAYDESATPEATSAVLSIAGFGRDQTKLAGHSGLVKDVAFSPDGTTLASAGQDRIVALWNVARGTRRGELVGHEAAVRSVKYSPDGRLLASADRAGRVIVWNAASGAQIRQLAVHNEMLDGLAFSPDGRHLAAVGREKRTIVWDVDTGEQLYQLSGYGGDLTELEYSPDGRTLAIADDEGRVVLWRPADDGAVDLLDAGAQALLAVAISPDGRTLAAAGMDRMIRLFDLERHEQAGELVQHTLPVRGLVFTDDGRTLVSAGYDHTVVLWDVERRDSTIWLTGHAGSLYGVAVSRDGRHIASGGEDEAIMLWDRFAMPIAGHTGRIMDLASLPGGRGFASVDVDGRLLLWDGPDARRPSVDRDTEDGGTSSVAASPDGRTLATIGRDGAIRLWDREEHRVRSMIEAHTDAGTHVVISPDGRMLVSTGEDGAVRLWDVATGGQVAELLHGPQLVKRAQFSPDGRLLATAGDDRLVTLWDVESRTVVARMEGHTKNIRDIAFSPDGSLLATGGGEGRVLLWDIERRANIAVLDGPGASLEAVAFSPDSRTVAAGGLDHAVLLWDVTNGARRATLTGHTDVVLALEFTPDGTTLLSSSGDQRIVAWPLDPESAIDRLCGELRFGPATEDLRPASGSDTC
jgi:WD40 repeat protein/energy-coupling factor transporter ATP-binding protein EcfA2